RRHTRFSRDWSSDVCSSDLRVRGLEQGMGIGMAGSGQDLFGAADILELAQIEDPDLITQVADHRQVMGDQQIGQLKSGLQVLEQIQNLSLNGYIQRRDRLVQQQYLR